MHDVCDYHNEGLYQPRGRPFLLDFLQLEAERQKKNTVPHG